MNVKPFVVPSDIEAARRLQLELKSQVILTGDETPLETLAGADLALSPDLQQMVAGVILYEYPNLREIERVYATGELIFPYVPGFLSFREGPTLVKAFAKLSRAPSVILFDGQGIAHPQRLGLASHVGLHLDLPSIGCAKSLLCGSYQTPALERGNFADIVHRSEVVGVALRTKNKVNPIFVSVGHRMGLPRAIEIVLYCGDGYRVPKPTREADRYVAALKKEVFRNGGENESEILKPQGKLF